MSIPVFRNWYLHKKQQSTSEENMSYHKHRWFSNKLLQEFGPQGLIAEYMEMVLQFGFITLFTLGFPLAPLFAFLNNVFEIRLDAKKLIKYFRQPIEHNVKDIGIWHQILEWTVWLSVITNVIFFISRVFDLLSNNIFLGTFNCFYF